MFNTSDQGIKASLSITPPVEDDDLMERVRAFLSVTNARIPIVYRVSPFAPETKATWRTTEDTSALISRHLPPLVEALGDAGYHVSGTINTYSDMSDVAGVFTVSDNDISYVFDDT